MSRNDDDTPYLSTDDSLPEDPYGFGQDSSFHADYGDDEDSGITIIDPARRQRRTLTRALIAICVMIVLAVLLWLFGTGENPDTERTASAPPAPNEPTLILPPLPPLPAAQDGGVAIDGDMALPPMDVAQASVPEESLADETAAAEPEALAPLPPPQPAAVVVEPPAAVPEPVTAPEPVAAPPEPAAPATFASPEPAAPATFASPEPAAPAPAATPAPAPAPEKAAPAPAPAQPKAEAAPAPAPAPKEGGRYAVRLGDFMPLGQAQGLLKDVLTQKESAAIQQRVTVGSFPNRAAARAEQARLAQNGHGDSVIVRGDNGFTVQLGVFSRASNAERLEQQLRAAGFDVNSAARVTMGPFASRAEAEQALAKVRQKNSVSGQIFTTR